MAKNKQPRPSKEEEEEEANNEDNTSSNKSKPKTNRRGGKKRAKFVLSFDEDDRQSFLTGFQKRKAERKQRAKDAMGKKLKEELKKMKEKRKEKLKGFYEEQVAVAEQLGATPESEATEYDLGDHIVNIQEIDIGSASASLGLTLGAPRKRAAK